MVDLTTPTWAKQLIKDVAELKKQTIVNCSKLTVLSKDTKKILKELPLIRVKIGTLCATTANTETNIKRVEKKVDKLT